MVTYKEYLQYYVFQIENIVYVKLKHTTSIGFYRLQKWLKNTGV